MLMGKQMILTILIVSLTFGTETKLQIVSVQLRSSAYRTFMSGDSAICILMFRLTSLIHSLLIIPFSFLILKFSMDITIMIL